MKRPLATVLAVSLFTAVAIGAGCARAPTSPPVAQPAAPSAQPEPQPATATSAAGTASAAVATLPPPPPKIRVPLQGEPDSEALGEVRLISSSCADVQAATRQLAEARIRQMRAEVDAQYESWKREQPYCWQQYRWQRDGRRYAPKLQRRGIGQALGAGGLGLSGVGQGGGGASRMPATAAAPRTARKTARSAERASGTNNQVAGVDEADIVKHDGRYVYVAMNGALRIVEALQPRLVSVTRLPGRARELFVNGDRAVVYVSQGGSSAPRCTYGYDCQFAGDGSSTKILVFDVSRRDLPRLEREIELSGSLMAARRIGNAIHTVVSDGDSSSPAYTTWPANLRRCGTLEPAVRSSLARLKRENERKLRASARLPTIREQGVEKPLCDNLLRTPIGDGRAFTTVVSFDLADQQQPAATATLQSRPGAVFASANALYLSVVHQKQANRHSWYSFYSSVDEVSDVHKFRIGERASRTRYLGSGVVPGHVLNQFSMDEWYGYLRVATTRGRVPDPRVESAVSILAPADDGNLVRVGAVEKIAPGEDIRSVRFDGDRGYVVTFKKTDPLFVLDLYHPAHPKVLGELKIPGFSTYMHRIDPNHLLSIGFDANDHGSFALFDGVILQLFDVSKPTQPRLLHKETIGTRGSSSEAATNHLAFNYFAEEGLLAIPMTICEGGGDGRFGTELSFSGLLVYDVSVTRGFRRLGGINHGVSGARCGAWWSRARSAVKRSIFLEDLVYSLATDRMKVQRRGSFGTDVADIALLP